MIDRNRTVLSKWATPNWLTGSTLHFSYSVCVHVCVCLLLDSVVTSRFIKLCRNYGFSFRRHYNELTSIGTMRNSIQIQWDTCLQACLAETNNNNIYNLHVLLKCQTHGNCWHDICHFDWITLKHKQNKHQMAAIVHMKCSFCVYSLFEWNNSRSFC